MFPIESIKDIPLESRMLSLVNTKFDWKLFEESNFWALSLLNAFHNRGIYGTLHTN